jgi:NADH dehydrogenase [ubiquinone] 1 alpha subcomplex assembly factor 2
MIGELSQRQLHPHWSSWLRFIRYEPPTLQELIDDEKRRQVMKVLAAKADARWKQESVLEDDKRILLQMMSAAREKVETNEQSHEQQQDHPIQTAQLQPKR